MNATERKRLRQAVYLAIASHNELIEAHRIAWSKKNNRQGMRYKIVPDRFKNLVRGWYRDIAAWQRLMNKYG